MRASILYLLVISTVACDFAQATKPIAERLAAQNTLFDEQY